MPRTRLSEAQILQNYTTGQTNDVLQIADFNGTVKTSFDKAGAATLISSTVTGNESVGGNLTVTGTSTLTGAPTIGSGGTPVNVTYNGTTLPDTFTQGTGISLSQTGRNLTITATGAGVANAAVAADGSITTAGILATGTTNASATNTAQRVVTRDSSGNFAAGIITNTGIVNTGTESVTGLITASGGVTLSGGSSNLAVGGTAAVTGATTLTGLLTANGGETVAGLRTYGATASSPYTVGSAEANGKFSTNGDAQAVRVVARCATTDATVTELFLDGSGATQRVTLAANAMFMYTIRAAARQDTGVAIGIWESTGVLNRVTAGNVTISGNSDTCLNAAGVPAGWIWAVDQDQTNQSLKMTFKGAAATNVHVVAQIELVMVV